MRLLCPVVIVCMGIIAISGCHKKPANAAEAKARVDAAIQISDPTQRDKALAEACPDAASIGSRDAVVNGVMKIGDPTLRDEVEADCAMKLQEAGQAAAATEVAKYISDPTKRDEILKKLSSGG